MTCQASFLSCNIHFIHTKCCASWQLDPANSKVAASFAFALLPPNLYVASLEYCHTRQHGLSAKSTVLSDAKSHVLLHNTPHSDEGNDGKDFASKSDPTFNCRADNL